MSTKKDPYRVRITVGGNLITYNGPASTTTADLMTSKLLWDSVLSTDDARYITIDIYDFYLNTPLKDYEYMKIPIHLVPDEFIKYHNLQNKGYYRYLYVQIQRGIYGLPQSRRLANDLLKQCLYSFGYYKIPHCPSLWAHTTRLVNLTLVVDNFGVKYVGTQHAQYLIETLQK